MRLQVLILLLVAVLGSACTYKVRDVVENRGFDVNRVYITYKSETIWVHYPAPVRKGKMTLPDICREFYNDGSDRWIDCMGVGYK